MSTKEVIAQEILCYDAVGRVSKLLDQFSSGLRPTGLLEIMKLFPRVICAPLHIHCLCISERCFGLHLCR